MTSPTPSRVVSRIEFHEPTRRPLRPTTPGRQHATHNGMIFANGSLHSGGKSHHGLPQDHNVLHGANHDANAPASSQIFSVGKTLNSNHVSLPSSKPGATPRTPRAASPSISHVHCKKRIAPTSSDEGGIFGTPLRASTPNRTTTFGGGNSTPRGTLRSNTPRNSHIVGLTGDNSNVSQTDSPTRARARKVLTKAPTFVPDTYTPKPFTPHKRLNRPEDHTVFGQPTVAELRQTTPMRTGRARATSPGVSSFGLTTGASGGSNPITWA